MGSKTSWLVIIFVMIVALVGCEGNRDKQSIAGEKNDVSAGQKVEKQKAESDATNIQLSGEVVNENGKFIVKGKSNLIEGTKVEIDWLDRPFSIKNPICLLCDKIAVVDKDGNFTYKIPTDLQNYGHSLVTIEVILGGLGQSDDITDVYGEHGENLKGPFVYKHEILDEEYQKIFASILVQPSGEKTAYPIETPKREKTPNDYGKTKVWIETDLTNDHNYFYIKGKSNLIEGTSLTASYYSSDQATLAQNWISSSANVVSDGTFSLQIPYDTITGKGFIIITSDPNHSHELKTKMKQIYGEQFEKMSGEQVIANEEGGNMIKVVLNPKPPIVKAPEKTKLTTDKEETIIQLPDDILFDFDKSDLKPDAQTTLNDLIQSLQTLKADTIIQVNGHTDRTGDEQYNMTLSEKRAKSVETYLHQNGKVDHLNITSTGFGETKPISTIDSEDGKALNRRVEIVINPK